MKELIFKPSEKLSKMRQKIIYLLIECKWDLVAEKYVEAIEKNEKIKKLFDEYLVDFVVNPSLSNLIWSQRSYETKGLESLETSLAFHSSNT